MSFIGFYDKVVDYFLTQDSCDGCKYFGNKEAATYLISENNREQVVQWLIARFSNER